MKKTVWFIVVTFNPDLKKLLALITKLKNYFVILIDNSLILPNYPNFPNNVTFIKNPQNLGFGPAFNIAVKVALKNGASWVINISPDVKISQPALSFFCQQISRKKADLYGAFAGYFDKKRWSTILSEEQSKTVSKFDYLSGEFLAISKKVFAKIGFFYEPYFLYYEDVDFCQRAKNARFVLKHLYHPGIRHESTPKIDTNYFWHQYYLARNHLLFVERHAPCLVKTREFIRLPETFWEEHCLKNAGAWLGLKDYFLRRFGPSKIYNP